MAEVSSPLCLRIGYVLSKSAAAACHAKNRLLGCHRRGEQTVAAGRCIFYLCLRIQEAVIAVPGKEVDLAQQGRTGYPAASGKKGLVSS